MKTLYVSDLDGTLFNRKKELTEYTADVINKLVAAGGLFSIATARMAYGCDYKLTALDLNIPVIVMNGVCLYDLEQKKYIDIKSIDNKKAKSIAQILDGFDCNAFLYSYSDQALSIVYKEGDSAASDSFQYLSERAKQACRQISKTNKLSGAADNAQVIYFALTGGQDLMQSISDQISQVQGIESSLYLNIYNGLYCLEIFDDRANKANALLELKEMVAADKVIVFGDNHNDVGMMRIADESYAPNDAVEEVKNIVDGIIGSCDEDGVARFIQENA